ncbi:unnamed protein product [Gulo gulo]|uniref:Uncharacterized protein n=1 Tax=Gulo gulo TaxID=48420 RepID=A0A9X9Q9A3_GULGU|nr:unnamed protein product [Gulo gulo]
MSFEAVPLPLTAPDSRWIQLLTVTSSNLLAKSVPLRPIVSVY